MARVLVIGAYGLIGSEITRGLLNDGHKVTGFGRNKSAAQFAFPDIDWVFGDLRKFQDADDWASHLKNIDVVVYAAGALQDTPNDDVETVQVAAFQALVDAAQVLKTQIVLISAAGVSHKAATKFFRTKAQAEDHLRQFQNPWWIFRPALVMGREAYGGTALLRMASVVPWVMPRILPDSEIQTISTGDVAVAVRRAVQGQTPANQSYDLAADPVMTLPEIICQTRAWLGVNTAACTIPIPQFLVRSLSKCADILGYLGWRSPLRGTAITVLEQGVTGDASQTPAALGRRAVTLHEFYRDTPSQPADLLDARLRLLFPKLIGVLAVFWIASGAIGIISLTDAAKVLTNVGWPEWIAKASVLFWAVIDVIIGVGFLIRKYLVPAALASLGVSVLYLICATVVTPALWLDPLGALVKVLPTLFLPVIVLAVKGAR